MYKVGWWSTNQIVRHELFYGVIVLGGSCFVLLLQFVCTLLFLNWLSQECWNLIALSEMWRYQLFPIDDQPIYIYIFYDLFWDQIWRELLLYSLLFLPVNIREVQVWFDLVCFLTLASATLQQLSTVNQPKYWWYFWKLRLWFTRSTKSQYCLFYCYNVSLYHREVVF